MSVELSSPDGLLRQELYRHVAVASGTRTVFIAGQTATSPDGVGVLADDLAGQVQAAIHGVCTAVRSAGGGPGDLALLTVFAVDWSEEKSVPLTDGLARAQESEGLAQPLPPLTVIGVQALYRPDVLVEIEAIAVLD